MAEACAGPSGWKARGNRAEGAAVDDVVERRSWSDCSEAASAMLDWRPAGSGQGQGWGCCRPEHQWLTSSRLQTAKSSQEKDGADFSSRRLLVERKAVVLFS